MSRSYGKIARGWIMDRGWHRTMRARERQCIFREMKSVEYGEVIFPLVSEVSDPWNGDYYHEWCYKKEIRDDYFKEINAILNKRCTKDWRWTSEDFFKSFFESFNRIKGALPYHGEESCYEWLNFKETKAIIKKWSGDPLDVLYYLTRAKIIEKAVSHELKQRTRK
jgi:hypothetical protein